MEFKYSDEIPWDECSTGGLSGSIPVRCNRYGSFEISGAARARKDWSMLIKHTPSFHGGASENYGLIQVAIPECRPERLEVLAYAGEIGFLYDDLTEGLTHNEVKTANEEMQTTFTNGLDGRSMSTALIGISKIQTRLISDMMSIDPVRARIAVKSWIDFLNDAAGRQHDMIHTSFGAYMEYRILDVGEMFWFGLVTFGMALTISEDELSEVRGLTRPCWVVLALQNDICSWEKEHVAAQRAGATHVVNALWYIMRDCSVEVEEAMALCKQQIATHIDQYEEVIAKMQGRIDLSKDAKIYLEALLYTISGDAAWSLVCPRYNRPAPTTGTEDGNS